MAWNGSDGNIKVIGTQETSASKKSRGLLTGMIVVLTVCAVVAVIFFLRNQSTIVPQAANQNALSNVGRAIAEQKPAAAPTNRVEKVPETKVLAEKTKPEFVKRPGALQLPDGQVLTFPPPQGDEIRKVYAYGHMYECDSKGNFKDVTPRQLFHTAFEGNFFALAQEGKPFIPAFLTGLDEEKVLEMLQKPYEPVGDETDAEKEQLKTYDQMRNAALDYIAQGGKFDDFVNDIAKFEKQERQTQATCLREVMTLVKEGKAEEAKEMYEAAKKLISDKGYRPMRIPPYVQQAFDQMP